MIQPVVKIAVFNKHILENGKLRYDAVPNYWIDDFIGLSTRYSIDSAKDTLSFSLVNHRELTADGSYDFSTTTLDPLRQIKLDTRDLLKVYAYNAPLTDSLENHLLMVAFVKSWDYDSIEGVGTFKINCYNRSEILLNSMIFAPYNEGEYVPNMLVESLNRIKTYNASDTIAAWKDYSGLNQPGVRGAYDKSGNRVYYTTDTNGYKVYTTEVTDYPETGYIRAYKADAYNTDGTLKYGPTDTIPESMKFKKATYTQPYKPFIDHLNEVSTPAYTGEETAGVYISYLDMNNNLIWVPKSFNFKEYIYEAESSSIGLSRNVDEVINAVIINCGEDPASNGILALAYNVDSMAQNGAKWKYLANTLVMEKIRDLEKQSTNAGGSNADKTILDNQYPSSYSPTGWVVQVSCADPYNNPAKWAYTAKVSTVTSDAEYKEYIRRAARAQGELAGKALVNYQGDPLFSGKREYEYGQDTIRPGELIRLDVPSVNKSGEKSIYLRVVAVNHTFDNSWNTTIELKEDLDYNRLVGIEGSVGLLGL